MKRMKPSLRIGFGAFLSGLAFALVQHAPPLAAQEITEFPLTAASGVPWGIVSGPDGNIWFTELNVDLIGRLKSDGSVAEFPLPPASPIPCGAGAVAVGPDGNLWYTRACSGTSAALGFSWVFSRIGRITPAGGVEEFPPIGLPNDITPGPDGNLWFADQPEFIGGQIGRISTTGVITEFPVPAANTPWPAGRSYPFSIAAGPDGNLWFTDYLGAQIGRISPTGNVVMFPLLSSTRSPGSMTAGPDGALWFTESDQFDLQGSWIARMTLDGSVTEFQVPAGGQGLATADGSKTIAAGPDGNLWFIELNANKIGRITPAGSITEFNIPTPNSGPGPITVGLDGNIWFTEWSAKKIGRLKLQTCASAPTDLCLGTPGRFRVTVVWSAKASDGIGNAYPITSNTGAFWFFDPTNLELVVKVLDGRSVDGHFWVFYGSLTDVEFTLTVTDSQTGAVKTYFNPQGQLASVADTSAF